jgi:hypothetical protein
MDRAVAEVTKALLDLAAPQPGERVLDIEIDERDARVPRPVAGRR